MPAYNRNFNLMTSKCWNSTPQNTIEYIHMHISTHSPHLLKFLRTNAFHFVHIINISWPIITLQFWVCKANIWVRHIISELYGHAACHIRWVSSSDSDGVRRKPSPFNSTLHEDKPTKIRPWPEIRWTSTLTALWILFLILIIFILLNFNFL